MERKYIAYGKIQSIACSFYHKHQERITFTRILKYLIEHDMMADHAEFPHVSWQRMLTLEEFRNYIDQIPVEATTIVSNPNLQKISEDFSIPLSRDVIGYSPSAFIDDKRHLHNYFEIVYIYQGSASLEIDHKCHLMNAGEVCIISPDTLHNCLVDTNDSLVISLMTRKSTFDHIFGSLLINEDLLAMFFRNTLYNSGRSKYLFFKTPENDPEIKRLIQRIMVESHSLQKYANAYVNCLVQEFFYILLREYSNTILYYGLDDYSTSQHQFPMILAYVQNNYSTVTLKSVADFFNYTESYLSKLFKKNMYANFNQVIQNLKMEKARELLLNTDFSVAEITEEIGYESPDYFTRRFKKLYGVTPTEFRKRS